MKTRRIRGLVWLLLVCCAVWGGVVGLTAAAGAALPVGYDHPESLQGGPTEPQGPVWLEKVWNRRIVFATKLPGGPLRVASLSNRTGQANLASLSLYVPVKATAVIPSGGGGHQFAPEDFRELRRLLAAGEKFDVFLLCKVDSGTIPLDVVYDILKRVKNGEAGLVLQDTGGQVHPSTIGLKPVQSGKQLIPGIPYEGLQQIVSGGKKEYGLGADTITTTVEVKPFEYGGVEVYQFGRGTVISIGSNSTVGNTYWGTPAIISAINLGRDMWAQNDYLYSHTLKAMLRAAGREQAVQISGIQPRGPIDGSQTPEVGLVAPAGAASVTLRWSVRDTWGLVSAQGKLPVEVPVEGRIVRLDGVSFPHAGRQFLDVWVDNAAGETLDWGSAFVDVNRGVDPPVITLQYESFTPRGEPLAGSVTAEAPAGAKLQVTLVDRNWRDVGRVSGPADQRLNFSFPVEGLNGQAWVVQADILDAQGRYLSRAFTTLRSPHTKATIGNWNPVATLVMDGGLEQAGGRELLRQIGFKACRAYGGWDLMDAEALIWSDIQPMPFPYHLSGPGDDYARGITDYEEPQVRAAILDSIRGMTAALQPYGLFGMNLTDDSSAARELPLGAYTNIKFHQWLQRQYGGFEETCEAWGYTPPEEEVAAEDLPLNPYWQVRFHEWLKQKYGDLAGLNKAWKLPAPGMWGGPFQWASITQKTIRDLHAKGNDAPLQDVAAFKQAFQGDATTEDPFGRITRASVKAAFDAGYPGPWIDAQRFLGLEWHGDMAALLRASQEVQPDSWVGTDAAFYGPGVAECFSQYPYVAPYYDHHLLKLAVARGRMERPGLYGVCTGSYGEKPANMSGRRGLIWDVAISGGTGYYYWMFRYFALTSDFHLSDAHALYQCETTEELNRGIGELLATARPVFAPIALLSSHTAALCDQLDAKQEPVTNHSLSYNAFADACEDVALTPWTVLSSELEGNWLQAKGIRLLVLPGAVSLSDKEIAAVEKFVNAGGVVVADVLPGLRQPNGVVRSEAPLASLFGVTFTPLGPKDKLRVRGEMLARTGAEDAPEVSFGEALADPRVKVAGATALGHIGETPAMLVNSVGKGKTFLFNASFNSYGTLRAEGGARWAPWNDTFKRILAAAGIPLAFPFTSGGKTTPGFYVSPFSLGRGYALGVADNGCGDFGGARRPLEITLPQASYVYDVRAGTLLGKVAAIQAEVPRNGYRVYSVLPYQVKSVDVKVDKPTCNAGDTITLTAEPVIEPAGRRDLHLFRVEAFTPKGEPFYPFRRVVAAPPRGALSVPLTTAYNDPPGNWRLVVTDVGSGVSSTVTVQIKGGGR